MTTSIDPEEKIALKKAGFLWAASYGGITGHGKTTGRAYLNLVKKIYADLDFECFMRRVERDDAIKAEKKTREIKEELAVHLLVMDSLRKELHEVRTREAVEMASIEHINNLRTENCRLIGENRALTQQIEELTQRTTS
jgi:hypothetical protein